MGEMHFLKAQILERIWSSTKEWNIKIKECKQECMMAYCVYSVEKNTMKKRKEIINYCEKRLGWQITDLVR